MGSTAGGLPPLIVICGATATGKTRLSLSLATSLGRCEIVSADSRQVYRGMNIGTAKVLPRERALVPHHGIDLVNPDEPFSVSAYQRHALAALEGIAARKRLALLVGGTGLYLRAVARGLDLGDESHDPVVRARIEDEYRERGLAWAVGRLQERAPEASRQVDLANPRRVVRALERAELLGDRIPPPALGYPAPVLWIGLRVDHALHREWIARRAAGQFAGGLLEEAGHLRARYDPSCPALSAIGYREALAVLDGRLTVEAALAETVVRTRAYARRQRTWFRAEPGIVWIDGERNPLPLAMRLVQGFLDESGRA